MAHVFKTLLYIIPGFILLGCWFFLTVNVPYWDDYGAIVKYLAEPWPGRWQTIWDFHNEHRIATTRLIIDTLVMLNNGSFNFRMMMATGNIIQFAYAMTWLSVFRKCRSGISAGIPVLWLLTSFIHYENTCWALCSVQNVIVVALIFATCLLFSKRKSSTTAFALALSTGVAATFSSGSGLLVWPCLVGMEMAEPFSEYGSWGKGVKNIFEHVKSSSVRLLPLLSIATIASYCYLIDFPGGTTEQALNLSDRIVNGFLFFVAFTGAILPVYPAAFALGLALMPIMVFIVMRYPRLKHPEIFWFMTTQLATMLAAAIFRASDPHTAVSSRYCIVSCSLFASILFLGLELCPLKKHLAKILLLVTTTGIILYTSAFLVLGAPLFAKRNELLRRNILTWPNHIQGLRTCNPEIDGAYLRKCVDRGIYNPKSLLKSGETPLATPEPWLR